MCARCAEKDIRISELEQELTAHDRIAKLDLPPGKCGYPAGDGTCGVESPTVPAVVTRDAGSWEIVLCHYHAQFAEGQGCGVRR